MSLTDAPQLGLNRRGKSILGLGYTVRKDQVGKTKMTSARPTFAKYRTVDSRGQTRLQRCKDASKNLIQMYFYTSPQDVFISILWFCI